MGKTVRRPETAQENLYWHTNWESFSLKYAITVACSRLVWNKHYEIHDRSDRSQSFLFFFKKDQSQVFFLFCYSKLQDFLFKASLFK